MTPEQITEALTSAPRRGRPRRYPPEVRAARQKAQSKAAKRASVALAHLYQDDYQALYRAACVETLAEIGQKP